MYLAGISVRRVEDITAGSRGNGAFALRQACKLEEG
jgi:hypothetical protein